MNKSFKQYGASNDVPEISIPDTVDTSCTPDSPLSIGHYLKPSFEDDEQHGQPIIDEEIPEEEQLQFEPTPKTAKYSEGKAYNSRRMAPLRRKSRPRLLNVSDLDHDDGPQSAQIPQ